MLYNVGVHVVRDGSFLQAIEGSIQFLQADLVSEQSRQYGLFQIRALPVSNYMYRKKSLYWYSAGAQECLHVHHFC